MPALDVRNFQNRVWLSGGRDQVPEGYLRRARGIAPEFTGSVRSMWPPQLLYHGINALNLLRFQNQRYQYDGVNLYKNGSVIYSSGSGMRGTFVSMPPAAGLNDYLFLAGSGALVKFDPSGTATFWGIQIPINSMQASNAAQEQITIDNFNASHTNWTPTNCGVADSSTIVAVGTGSLHVSPSGGPWKIINNSTFTVGSAPIDLGNYSGGDISLPTDAIALWVYDSPSNAVLPNWMEIDFDVNDGSFKKDYYSIVIQFSVPGSTTPVTQVNPAVIYNLQPNTWLQIFLPKQMFRRVGTTLNLDWTNVVAVRFSGDSSFTDLYLDNLQVVGGAALGQGPAVALGGSEYSYYAVYRNTTTGNQSNPQDVASNVQGVALNKVALTHIPLSPDAQVGARDLYRTSAENTGGGQTAFYLDTIYDNTTTTYTDSTADISVPLTLTPWQASVAVPPNAGALHYYVDGGNGYIFRLITAGTTGAALPAWKIPTAVWSALSAFAVGETISPLLAAGRFFVCAVAGTTGTTQPNWAAVAPLGNVTDGGVTWTDTGVQNTNDGTAIWRFYGINSTPVLGTEAIRYDNVVPPSTIADAVGPYQGSMVWTRDGAQPGRVYFSPPGRAEGVGTFVDVSTANDPVQKAVIFQNGLWIVTSRRIIRMNGQYPSFTPVVAYVEGGTQFPFTVFATEQDVFYRSTEGIRAFNWGSDRLYAFEAIAPVQRGQTVEDVPPFYPTVAGIGRDEVYFSDETQLTMALNHVRPVWRTFDLPITAVTYEDETGEVIASYGGNVYLFEHQSFTGTPIAFDFEVQTPSVELSNAMQNLSQRVYLDIDTANQIVTPSLLVDGGTFVLPAVTTNGRATIELPYQAPGHVFGVLLQAQPQTGIIEVFRIAVDIAA
jgi:hypothetical protein